MNILKRQFVLGLTVAGYLLQTASLLLALMLALPSTGRAANSEAIVKKFASPEEAVAALEALQREGNLDPETTGLLAGRYKLRELISRRLGLADINRAYDLLQQGEVKRSVLVYE
jgi:uncharacterized protein YutE (UPF0331/DUF86 family)